MKKKSKISGSAAVLMRQVTEAGLTACCTSKNHLKVILFCHRHGIESPLKDHCAGIPVNTYSANNFLFLKSTIYDRIVGSPGVNAVLEALQKSVEPAAINTVIYLLDTEGIPQADSALFRYSQRNLLGKRQNHQEILTRALKILELSAAASLGLEQQPSSKHLLSRKKIAASFNSFMKLPTEIRLMIWKLGITGRVVELYHCKGRINPACPTPALLQVNRESRQVAQKTYYAPESGNAFGEVIFSYDLDTLYLSRRASAFQSKQFIIEKMCGAERWIEACKRLKRIAFFISGYYESTHDVFVRHLSRFSELEEVTIIVYDNVLAFEPHKVELVEHDYNLKVRQRLASIVSKKFKLLDVHAERRAPNTPVFNTKLVRSYRVG